MAIRAAVHNNDISKSGGARVVTWTGLLNGDTGDWISLAEYSGKTFQVYGTFGAATVTLQGSNDPSEPVNAATLTSWQATALTLTAAGFATARDMPTWVRPIVTSGSGTTSLNVTLCAHRTDIAQMG